MVDAIGYDIGGANTKAAFVSVKNGKLLNATVSAKYFPVWKETEKLESVFLTLKQQLGKGKVDGLGVTMTAELSDAYQTKREGVTHILGCLKKTFPNLPIYVLDTFGELKLLDTVNQAPLRVASANWIATGWLVTQHFNNCVVVDVGSTSTSIIPIANGKIEACGKTDLEKLSCGELVYTGSLRTNVAAIVQSIPIRQGVAGVSSELFALSGDVHLLLGNIDSKDYTSETADGRGKSFPDALARLSRVVCADTEMLTQEEIINMAKYIYCMQIRQVAEGLAKVYSYMNSMGLRKVPVVVTGLGKNFIARKAAESVGVDAIIDLGTLVPEKAVLATPAFSVALMVANKLEGETNK